MCGKNTAAHVWALNPGGPGMWSATCPRSSEVCDREDGRWSRAQPLPVLPGVCPLDTANISPSKHISRVPLLSLEGDSQHRLHGERRRGRTLGLAASEPGHRVAHRRGRRPVPAPNPCSRPLPPSVFSPRLRAGPPSCCSGTALLTWAPKAPALLTAGTAPSLLLKPVGSPAPRTTHTTPAADRCREALGKHLRRRRTELCGATCRLRCHVMRERRTLCGKRVDVQVGGRKGPSHR